MLLSLVAVAFAVTLAPAADVPKQAPPAMTEQQIKDYVDAAVKAEVKAQLNAVNPALLGRMTARALAGYTLQSCPAGATCPPGCIDNGDGTCSCPPGTSCGTSQYGATYSTQAGYTTSYAADDGSDDSGAPTKRVRFHLFGKPHRR
jgi:hypothetical protein